MLLKDQKITKHVDVLIKHSRGLKKHVDVLIKHLRCLNKLVAEIIGGLVLGVMVFVILHVVLGVCVRGRARNPTARPRKKGAEVMRRG